MRLPKLVTVALATAALAASSATADPGHGKPSKEWVAVDPKMSRRWGPLAEEARDFVISSNPVTGNRLGAKYSSPH